MKTFKEEIENFSLNCSYCEGYKNTVIRKLHFFLDYLAKKTETPVDEVHLEKIYETVSITGETLFFSRLDSKLVELFFFEHLDNSYNWLDCMIRALQSIFRYLFRKYDFPNLIEEMGFNLEDYKQKPNKREKYVPTRHDLLRFLQSLLKYSRNLEKDALFFLLLMTTGSRPSEIINVQICDIDFVNEIIYRKTTKNKSSKYIVLREGFGKVLRRFKENNCLKYDDYLINNNGKKMKLKQMQEIFASFLDQANLPFMTLHSLRHAFATIMAESGAEVLVIQQLLGHKKINSTSTYINGHYIRNYGMELQVNKDVYKHLRKLT